MEATLVQPLLLLPELAVANLLETGKARANMGNPDHRSAGLSGRRRRADKAAKGVCAIVALACLGMVATAAPPTPEEYVAKVGPDAKLVPPGQLKIDGRKVDCGKRPTVWDSKLDDYGAAYAGFLILNPKLFARISMPVKLWIHAHECGHQFRGPDEETADCFAVQRGRRAGWLTPDGLEEVCKFIAPAQGDSMHFSGSHRCEAMRKCYADPTVR